MAGTPKPIGRVLLIGKGDYVATSPYDMLDWVRHNGKSWVCQVDGTIGIEPADNVPEWRLMTEDGYQGSDGRGLANVTETVAGKLHTITMEYTDGSTPFEFTVKDGNDGGGGGGGGGDMYKATYDTTDNGMVDTAEELYDVINNKKANTVVLAKLSESGSGQLEYNGSPIGGVVGVDDTTIKKNASSGNLYVPIDEKTLAVNSSNKLEVPIDTTSLEYDSSSKKVKVASAITTKLSQIGEQILGVINGDTITFTDTTYIGGTDSYLLDPYVSDTGRFLKSQSISGNTLTVVCDDVIASGSVAVCLAFKKGV